MFVFVAYVCMCVFIVAELEKELRKKENQIKSIEKKSSKQKVSQVAREEDLSKHTVFQGIEGTKDTSQ